MNSYIAMEYSMAPSQAVQHFFLQDFPHSLFSGAFRVKTGFRQHISESIHFFRVAVL